MTGIADPKNLQAAWAERFNARDVAGLLALGEPGCVFAPQPGVVVIENPFGAL
ncbi:hypothetical protein [Streptomyces sp. NPDC004788]